MAIAARIGNDTLRRGAKGAVVKEVQLALRVDGQELVPDDMFGAITEAAVKRFQAAHGG